MSEVLFGAALSGFHVTPTSVGPSKHEQIAGTLPFVFVIITWSLTRLGWDRLSHVTDQLARALIKAHPWSEWIFRLSIQVQHIFHMVDKLCTDLRNAPLFLLPRLQFVFLACAAPFRRRSTPLA